MDVQQVQIDLYPEAGQGAYDVEVQAGPKDLGSAGDLPAQSGDLSLEVRPEKPRARRLTFTTVVPGPFGSEPLTHPGRLLCAYLYHALDEAAIISLAGRILDGYSRFYATRGVHYAGVFSVAGPAGPCLAELIAYDADNREEAMRIGGENLPPFITPIHYEYPPTMSPHRP